VGHRIEHGSDVTKKAHLQGLGIVIDGLLRTFMNAPNGRQVCIS